MKTTTLKGTTRNCEVCPSMGMTKHERERKCACCLLATREREQKQRKARERELAALAQAKRVARALEAQHIS